MSLERNKELVSRLLERTRKKTLDWKEAVDYGFQVSFRNSSIKLQEFNSGGSKSRYLVSLVNAAGELADSFTDTDLDFSEIEDKWRDALQEIYNLALRYVRGADEVLDNLLAELGDDIPF
jgi:3'-phosphoadenosine 5'-phosphosulfate sulfotransferase (PAPS reductase)/FAD synthetase